MTTTYSQTVFSPWLTPVRLLSTANIAGTYYNGLSNNGVGATLTIAASSLTIDGVVCNVGDRVLLQTQTTTYQQGIYVVESIGSTVVLQRSDDMQSLEQMQAGQNCAVGAGTANAGVFLTLVEPLPQVIGVSAIVFNDNQAASAVAFSGGAATIDGVAVFANADGDIKEPTAPVVLGQSLAVTGDVSATDAIEVLSPTPGNGRLRLLAADAGGAFDTAIRNGTMGQSTIFMLPDPSAATSDVLVKIAPLVNGNLVDASGTNGVMADSGIATSNVQLISAVKADQTADIGGAGAGPITFAVAGLTAASVVVASIVSSTNAVSVAKVAPGVGGFDITFDADPGAACVVSYVAYIAAQ